MDSNHLPANLDTESEPRESEKVAEGNREATADASSRVFGGRLLPDTMNMETTLLDDSAKSKKHKKKRALTAQPSGPSAPGILIICFGC